MTNTSMEMTELNVRQWEVREARVWRLECSMFERMVANQRTGVWWEEIEIWTTGSWQPAQDTHMNDRRHHHHRQIKDMSIIAYPINDYALVFVEHSP